MDSEQIDNILSNGDKEVIQFSDAQWLYLQDNNNQQYASYVQWITSTLKQQFIDYHNAFCWIPARIEVPDPGSGATFGPQAVPPLVAMRESVLSAISTVIVSTDQGQTLVNDVNTQFINNIRLKIENNLDWVHTEGSELDFGYDQYEMVPNSNIYTATAGPLAGAITGPSFWAPLGVEPGNLQSSPLTNDPSEFGNSNVGAVGVTAAGGIWTAIGGYTFTNTTATVQVPVNFNDGRTGFISVGTTSGAAATLTSFGGVVLSQYTGLATGVYTTQAIGYATLPSQTLTAETFNIPVTFTVVTAGAAPTSFTSIGGQLQSANPTNVSAYANGQSGSRNPNYNKGFKDRVTIFQNTSAYKYYAPNAVIPSGNVNTNGYHVYWYIMKVPLKMLHDFFMQLNLPIINIGFNLQFYFAQGNGLNANINYPPFQIGNNKTILSGGQNQSQVPSVYYGQTYSGGTGCRLYYRSVKFSPADTARMAQKLTTGFTKSLKFISTDWVIPPGNIIAPGTGPVQQQLEQSVVHPCRVWVLPYPNNTNLAPLVNSVPVVPQFQGSFISSYVYASGILPGQFTSTNILVNNVPYWRQDFTTPTDHWNQLKEQFTNDKGSMLRYVDWLNFQRYLCFDISRISLRLQSPTEPVSLIFKGQRNDGMLYQLEMFYLIERMNQITMRFSSSDVAIVVGNLD
jgi:hypothetical protein